MAGRISTRKYLASKMAQGQGGYVTTAGDDKTCAVCAGKSGKFSSQTPPFHANCRCKLGAQNK